MTLLQLITLAVVQGTTEFLPISSSAHLILTPIALDWPDQGLTLDVAVHVGTLGAVLIYLWRDLWAMVVGLGRVARGRRDPHVRLMWQIILATLPLIGAGFLVNAHIGDTWRSITVIGWTTLGFGALLWLGDKIGMTIRRLEHMSWGSALIIGLAQVAALIPGVSRSGITMTLARFLGFERADCARFSLLLSIPAIAGAGALKGWELWQSDDQVLFAQAFTAAGLAAITALFAIAIMMAWLRRANFLPFVIYRLLLGGGLLMVAYFY